MYCNAHSSLFRCSLTADAGMGGNSALCDSISCISLMRPATQHCVHYEDVTEDGSISVLEVTMESTRDILLTIWTINQTTTQAIITVHLKRLRSGPRFLQKLFHELVRAAREDLPVRFAEGMVVSQMRSQTNEGIGVSAFGLRQLSQCHFEANYVNFPNSFQSQVIPRQWQ